MSPDEGAEKVPGTSCPPVMSAAVIAVFARAPVVGRVKTRLARAVGDDMAMQVHRELLDRTLGVVASVDDVEMELWLDGPVDQFAARGVPVRAQGDGDLGERMLAVVADITQRGRAAIVVGSDCPVLDAAYVRAANKALREGCDAVLGPVEDGGYILIGMSRPIPELMIDVVWSTPTVYAETLRRAAALGLNVVSLPTLWDIDDAADLDRWRGMPA